VYWKNLVLGDPMAAPYAVRPSVSIDLDADRATVTATHSDGIGSVLLFVDGEAHDPLEPLPHRTVELLAVAQAEGEHRPKGWASMTATPMEPDAGVVPDAEAEADASVPDTGASFDAGVEAPEAEGCSCSSTGSTALRRFEFALMIILIAAITSPFRRARL
jgi:hypothetical protein